MGYIRLRKDIEEIVRIALTDKHKDDRQVKGYVDSIENKFNDYLSEPSRIGGNEEAIEEYNTHNPSPSIPPN